VAVLDDVERNLVLNLFDAEGCRRLVLDDEALDLVIGEIPAGRNLVTFSLMISRSAIYCTLVVQDAVIVEQP
jgi:hypothetical protein